MTTIYLTKAYAIICRELDAQDPDSYLPDTAWMSVTEDTPVTTVQQMRDIAIWCDSTCDCVDDSDVTYDDSPVQLELLLSVRI